MSFTVFDRHPDVFLVSLHRMTAAEYDCCVEEELVTAATTDAAAKAEVVHKRADD